MTSSSQASHHSASTHAALERLVWWHLAIFIPAVTWMFGGRVSWAYLPLSIWGTLGATLTVLILLRAPQRRRRNLLWMLPWALLNGLILGSTLNPSLSEFVYYGEVSLRPANHHAWLPSSAIPSLTLHDLWLYNGLYLSGFNLLTGVRTRRAIRSLFILAVINGAVLAVFGTIQKLLGTDIFFGLKQSPNPAFFSTFIYHNHWGAFSLLISALGLGIAAHHLRREAVRDFWHSPVPALLLAVVLVLITIPLSSSRSSTVLMLLLGAVAFGYAFVLTRRYSRRDGRSRTQASILLVLVAIAALGVSYFIAQPVIERRIRDTIDQVQRRHHYALVKSQQVFYGDARLTLYRDTLRMISDKPVWGWGYGCYGQVFMRYNSQSTAIARWPSIYMDAHSDWLEALAEIGIAGTLLLVGFGLGPLFSARRFIIRYAETSFPLLGCILICVYGLVEFPFVNPAVCLTFWVALFGSVRIALITEINNSA